MNSPLTVEYRNRHLLFAQDPVHRHHHDIQGVLWTDDFIFCQDFNYGRWRVLRKRNERFKDCCDAEHDRFGGESVMVWANDCHTDNMS